MDITKCVWEGCWWEWGYWAEGDKGEKKYEATLIASSVKYT